MVRDQTNQQWPEAEKFASRVISHVDKNAAAHGYVPSITVTGHSLGGTLAELTAAKYHLKGETFNSYGAVDLDYGLKQNSAQVVNHILAGDVVSAASHHVGTVEAAATTSDVASLHEGHYLDGHGQTPNPLLTMRLSDHGIGNFAPDPGKGPSVLSAANAAVYEQNKVAFDQYRGDLHRERSELATAMRQMESGTQPLHLPPEIQRQVNEYLAVDVDPAMQKAIEQNVKVTGVEHALQHGADGVRAGSHYVQTQDERVATTARTVGNFVAPVAPLAPLAGAAFGEAAHLQGQAVHAVGDYAANTLQSVRQTVEQDAHRVTQAVEATIHNPEFQAGVVSGVNRVIDTYHRVETTEQNIAHTIDATKQSMSHRIDAAERATTQAYDTLTHPVHALESAVASKISSEMSPAVDATRHQQRALHGEGSQVDRASEAQRQQEMQGHAAALEAPLPPAPVAISPGARTSEREASPFRQEPRPAARGQEAQAPTQAHHEPTTAPAAPDHAALATQQAHQQGMHTQRHAQQERQQRDERAAPSPRAAASQEPGRIAEAAALAPELAPGILEAATVAPTIAASLRDAPIAPHKPSQPDREASTQAQPEPQRHEPTAIAAPEHARAQPAASNPAPAPTPFSERVASAQNDGPQASAQRAVPERANAAPVLSPPLDPPALKDFRHPDHPLNERYQMFREALGEKGFHEARPTLNQTPEVRGYSAEQKDRLAAGFTAQVGSDRQFNTEIQHFRKDGDALLAIERPERLGDAPLVLALPEKEALARSPEQHAAGWRARELPEPQAVDAQRRDPKSLSPEHPGHPDHPRNAMFEHAREALTTEYARWGIQKGAEQLDRETVQVMTVARAGKMDEVGAVRLMPNRDEGKIGEFPKMQVFESPDAPGRVASTVFVEGQTLQHAPPTQRAGQQFQQVDQQATQQIQQNQQLQAQINAQAPQAQGMGR